MTGQHAHARETSRVRRPVCPAGRVRGRRRGDLRAGPDRIRPLQHGADRRLAVPAVLRAGRRGRRVRGAARAPRGAGRIGPGPSPGRLGPGGRLEHLQLDARPAPPGRRGGVRADAGGGGPAVRVLPAGTQAAHAGGPCRPHAERLALASPGRTHPGPARMAADEQVPAEAATRHVRADHAARRLYQLKTALGAHDQPHAAWRVARAPHPAGRAPRSPRADPCRVRGSCYRHRGAPPGPGADHDRRAGQARLSHP